MKYTALRIAITALLTLTLSPLAHADTTKPTHQNVETQRFETFVTGIQKEAREKGISEKTIQKYLTGLKAPRPKPLKNLKTNPAAKKLHSFDKNIKASLKETMVTRGRQYFKQYHALLQRVQERYHVQPAIIVAIWGMETHYGEIVGTSPLVSSLVTLAYQQHRSSYYREQIFYALKILEHQFSPKQAISTWDGGMGQASFEPSTYFEYAVDFDKNGKKNIWTSVPDTFGSIANFLHLNGWDGQQPWGIKVKVPSNFPLKLTGRDKELTLSRWTALGVRTLKGGALPNVKSEASLLLPSGIDGPAFFSFS